MSETTAIKIVTQTAFVSRQTHINLDAFLRQQTILWNAALQERIDCFRKTGKTLTFYDQCKSLTAIRRDDSDFNQFHVTAQRTALDRLDKGFNRFFKRLKAGEKPGFPRFKSRYRGFSSFGVPNPRINGNKLIVKGIGTFKVRNVPDNIRMVQVVKTSCHIEVQFVCEVAIEHRAPDIPIGIDLGIEKRATTSDGEIVPSVKLDLRKAKRRQRAISRAKKGSNSRRKKVLAYGRERERIRIQQRNATHRITSDLVKRHNCIAVEDLKIQNMVKNKYLARRIHEQGWGYFVQQLTYKAENAGGKVIKVAPRNTSKTCSECGHIQDMKLSERTYRCGECGLVMDRDINAARNILYIGWEKDSPSLPDASENVVIDAAAIAGQDAEKYTELRV